MNFSNFFISRPIFATVLAIILTLVGAMAMRILPIEQYPSVVPPTVSVQAQFPGADAETVAQTVAAPLASATMAAGEQSAMMKARRFALVDGLTGQATAPAFHTA